jgi:hypothetical protein
MQMDKASFTVQRLTSDLQRAPVASAAPSGTLCPQAPESAFLLRHGSGIVECPSSTSMVAVIGMWLKLLIDRERLYLYNRPRRIFKLVSQRQLHHVRATFSPCIFLDRRASSAFFAGGNL